MAARFMRFTNGILLFLLVFLTLTGLFGLVYTQPAWTFEAHRVAAWSTLALLPWKGVISWRSLKRGLDPRFDRSVIVGVSLVATVLLGVVLITGFLWTWRIGPEQFWIGQLGDALIGWHWILALMLWAPLAIHIARRWPRPRVADFTARRSSLKMLALTGAGLAGWSVAELIATWRADPAHPRAFTGSREVESGTGDAMPVTLSLGERELDIAPDTWSLSVMADTHESRFTYGDVLQAPTTEVEATLDCTSGWYSTQRWRGTRLTDLLAIALPGKAVRAVRLSGQSGYNALVVGAAINDVLLATHLGGKPLTTRHGFPVRAVVPGSRGWEWVKWLTRIEVLVA